MSGLVINRADIVLKKTSYDMAIVGGGFLGLSLAFYLRKLLPEASLLLIEEEGIPSEQGMTHVSPGILDISQVASKDKAKFAWGCKTLSHLVQETGIQRSDRVVFKSGIRHFVKDNWVKGQAMPLDETKDKGFDQMLALSQFPSSFYDATGAYASAEAASLYYGYGAVKLGLDLMLNARAEPIGEHKLRLKRLEYNRFMQRVVVKEEMVQAETVIVALGAKTADFVEEGWGELLPYKQVYSQYPRIEVDKRLPLKEGKVDLPIMAARGFYFRPQGEGLLIIPPPLPADPKGYKPEGANLLGVRVGVRRELLELFLEAMPDLSLLGWESLNLGKTVANIRAAWDVITPNGEAEWRNPSENCFALVGAQASLAHALAKAYDLAAHLAKLNTRPWSN